MPDIQSSHALKRPWFEPLTVILMGAATFATAWSSFENSRWDARSRDLSEQSDELARQSLALNIDSLQIKIMHFQIFSEIVNAKLAGDQKRADFYSQRVSDELKPAFEKWNALDPFGNPTSPPHPFVKEFYKPRHEEEIRASRLRSAQAESRARTAGGYASSHLTNTIILSAVLLFAGTARTFDQRRVRTTVLGFAVAFFLYSMLRMALLPLA